MTTKEHYNRKIERESRDWWCKKQKTGKANKSAATESVVAWRIGWSCRARKKFGDREAELLAFFKSIDSGNAWERGKAKGIKHARLTSSQQRDGKTCYEERSVIDLRHAAWLFGWFEGYIETRCAEVWRHVCGPGSLKGGCAGEAYIRLLYDKRWMHDGKVEQLLGISRERVPGD